MPNPHLTYFICATPRTGSVFLCQLLHGTRIAGRPREYFGHAPSTPLNQRQISLSALIERAIERGTTPNGVFAAKLFWDHFNVLTKSLQRSFPQPPGESSLPRLLTSFFPNLQYIWLTRHDKVRQAVSLERLAQRKLLSSQQRTDSTPIFNFARINLLYHRLLSNDESWRCYFEQNGISPLKLAYEDLIDGYEEIARAIMEYLKIPARESASIRRPRSQQLADALTEEWVHKFLRLRRQASETRLRTQHHLSAVLTSLCETGKGIH